MTIESWLQPVSEDLPCGPNLEDDLDFLSLEESSREKRSEEFRKDDGDTIQTPKSKIDWFVVHSLAEGLLTRSKDLRVAIYLMRAALHIRGFTGIVDGLALIKALLERFWDDVHPQLEADSDNDPTMRINALVPLASNDALIGDLRSSYLLNSRSEGQLTVREIEVAQGLLAEGTSGTRLSESQLHGLLSAAIAENPDLPQQASEAQTSLKNILQIVDEHIGSSYTPDLKPLQYILNAIIRAIREVRPAVAEKEALASLALASGGSPLSTPSAGGLHASGLHEIRSRQDVLQILDRLCDYLARTEPTNPVQIVLRRAQRMMNMTFLELMQDIAPDGLEQAQIVVGEKLNPDSEE
ncbi:MAG TPA: type VI secretion system protein TssA [Bacillota bacterium]|nr:type VI secretion system protein TssA [Bacillota bacterium]